MVSMNIEQELQGENFELCSGDESERKKAEEKHRPLEALAVRESRKKMGDAPCKFVSARALR